MHARIIYGDGTSQTYECTRYSIRPVKDDDDYMVLDIVDKNGEVNMRLRKTDVDLYFMNDTGKTIEMRRGLTDTRSEFAASVSKSRQ